MTPREYCQAKAAASGSSFYYSFAFLAPARRHAITALYAFCREVDDAVDDVDAKDSAAALARLDEWREEIDRVFAGEPRHPVGLALRDACGQFDLKRERLLEIVDGMAMDLQFDRYPDFSSLLVYCRRVASAVGILAAAIFGYEDERTLDYARDLGIAFQLTNIIRDVGEDARRGRIYLPGDELSRFGVAEDDILQSRTGKNFRALMAFQATRAEQYYERALAALPAVDRARQRPGLAMAAIYRALLRQIVHDGYRVFDRRATLPGWRKLWLAASAWLKG
ncbi:MAG: presqualene diphosphate synthase HpnD [Azoarcus sp.]|jgi:phytoene synthase|nr:presqualene diphosphate synthase HpnD [Azoarcus sp.]